MVIELIDHAFFVVGEFADYLYLQAISRDAWGWFWFFMPLVILAEGPRYVLPAIGMATLRALGLLRNDEQQKRDFIATNPRVTIIIAGLNEEKGIGGCIRGLLEMKYPNLEIIVVDDNSTDRMYEVAKPFADRGEIQLYKNTAASGRQGRPACSNLGLRMATGEFILSLDADTSFDRGLIHHMIGPFYDPKVGIVGGNLKAANAEDSFWARMQAIEYLVSIGLWKQWLDVLGMNFLASGALGAFRKSVLDQVGGWDPELGEDACLSLKVKKCGYTMAFAEKAVGMTDVPNTLSALAKQRLRWDKSGMRTFYRKHGDMFNFRVHDWRNAVELGQEWFFSVFCTFMYPVYLVWMLYCDPMLLIFAWTVCLVFYTITGYLSTAVAISFSERKLEEAILLRQMLFMPAYKGVLRWVRFYSLLLETFRINYDDSFLPRTAWKNTPRW
ncbi:MAG: glycosyltransferase family 2 protein [Planctomycetes bacterium]|nr:glycosyltransferase family 2 protein [Planctomycetota bacterium]